MTDTWFRVTERVPENYAVVQTYRDGYQEVCVFRIAGGANKFITHGGMRVDASHWRELFPPPQEAAE